MRLTYTKRTNHASIHSTDSVDIFLSKEPTKIKVLMASIEQHSNQTERGEVKELETLVTPRHNYQEKHRSCSGITFTSILDLIQYNMQILCFMAFQSHKNISPVSQNLCFAIFFFIDLFLIESKVKLLCNFVYLKNNYIRNGT